MVIMDRKNETTTSSRPPYVTEKHDKSKTSSRSEATSTGIQHSEHYKIGHIARVKTQDLTHNGIGTAPKRYCLRTAEIILTFSSRIPGSVGKHWNFFKAMKSV